MKQNELRRAVREAASAHEEQTEQRYHDTIWDLALRFGVEEEDIEQLWDEEAP